jgi:phage tail-like protein
MVYRPTSPIDGFNRDPSVGLGKDANMVKLHHHTIVPKSFFSLFDVPFMNAIPSSDHVMANFDNLTGGEMVVSTIPYSSVDENGKILKKFIPGPTNFSPITLLRGFDARTEALYNWFLLSENGKLKEARRNLSIAMLDYHAGLQVAWNLFNAIPTKITGFSFNSRTAEYYTDFELTVQAERIEIA